MNKLLRRLSLPALCCLVACSSEHPLAGNWTQRTDSDAVGATIEFDGASDRVMVHLAPNADGTHGHKAGTYSFDAATNAVTVRAAVLGDGKPGTWTGKLDGQQLQLSADGTQLEFTKGGKVRH